MKRLIDLMLALALAVPAFLIVLAAAIAVALDSPGSPFLRQIRIGRHREPFTMIKLRTMTRGTATAASHEISSASITRLGALLRKWKIDELPQLWSVIKGDMSFVGPRPCLPIQHLLIAERDKLGVFEALPGITGAAQMAGIDMSTPIELAEIDASYVSGRSTLGDIAIILATLRGSGRGDAVKSA